MSTGGAPAHGKETQLNELFDKLKGAEDSKDALDADSTMSYFQNLGANLEDASLFIALELVQAENIGQITREGFVKGWASTPAEASLSSQKQYFSQLESNLSRDPDLFRKVYRHAFVAGKEADQRALSLENATIYWDMLFAAPGFSWVGRTSGVNWLAQWKAFLEEKWTRSVSRDMWQQVQVFAAKSAEDESLSFYSPEGSWPGVIDDFVAWYRSKNAMEIDA
ncbi:Cullin binding-domain-containing protein [Microdochium trichocladiopsis]|uniref:Defective in cullin neddylation protein n=1 Tax=Microdochium trichocladiopsis TaxID=1682393 RepID=A0A9P8YKT7_9PEZI|nr:Cullin binding-domain-containing protein [Microdochium trichocladiopsis]KAH7041341.1 Cullin binding-domain-containing protein [Microdochium trichocladiopsis]